MNQMKPHERGKIDSLGTQDPHPEHLYDFETTADSTTTFGEIGKDAVARLAKHGYLAVDRVYSDDVVKDTLDDMTGTRFRQCLIPPI